MVSSAFLYVEMNCFAIAILCVIALNMRRQDGHYLFDQKLFLMLLAANILLLFLDTILRVFDGNPSEQFKLFYIGIIVPYNILNPVICIIWYYYVDYYVYGDQGRITQVLLPIFLPVLVNALLSVLSIFFNIYFAFDENNSYYRGRFIWLLLGICLYIIIYTDVFLIRNRVKIKKREFVYLLFFAILPSIGGIVQFIFPGVNIIWIAATLSVYIIFINIQKDQMHIDYLTGVHNRRYLDSYLQTITKDRGQELIAGIMLDIDAFKMINDVYGHDHGDQALKYTAQILRKTFRKADFIARYGGDEFVIMMKIEEPSELAVMVQRLTENITLFNSQKLAPYNITLSIGYDCYKKESGMSIDEFLIRIDHLMYENKRKTREEGK